MKKGSLGVACYLPHEPGCLPHGIEVAAFGGGSQATSQGGWPAAAPKPCFSKIKFKIFNILLFF
jgi:hypothetical protein